MIEAEGAPRRGFWGIGGVDGLAQAKQGRLKRSRSKSRAGMKNPGSLMGLEKAIERAVGPVCGLGSCFGKAKMEQVGRE